MAVTFSACTNAHLFLRKISTITDNYSNGYDVLHFVETCDDYPSVQHACESREEFARDAFQFCNKLLSNHKFKACADTINLSELTDACLWDYCACKYDDRRKCACNTMDVYIRQCAHKGITQLTAWRNDDTCRELIEKYFINVTRSSYSCI